jgi:hypothetical protein
MDQSPSWEANRLSESQEIHRNLWRPKVHYRSYKCQPQTRPFLWVFRNMVCFYGEALLATPQPPSWRTTPCRLFVTAYSIYLRLPSILEAFPPTATWGRTTPWCQELTYYGKRAYLPDHGCILVLYGGSGVSSQRTTNITEMELRITEAGIPVTKDIYKKTSQRTECEFDVCSFAYAGRCAANRKPSKDSILIWVGNRKYMAV